MFPATLRGPHVQHSRLPEPPLGSSPYFDSRARGGAIASRVDAQDTVAALIAVEAISGSVEGVPAPSEACDVVLLCEGREDLELAWPTGRLLVPVKDQVLSMTTVRKVLHDMETAHGDLGPSGRAYPSVRPPRR